MKTITKITLVVILMFCTQLLNAQPWMQNIKAEKPTLPEIQKSFYDFWQGKEIEKGKGYKQFKRWEWYWEQRVSDNGEFPSPSVITDEWKNYVETHPESQNKSLLTANWIFKGPTTTPGGYNGLGRINCIAFHPTIANTFWVGTPAGGLWKTTNGGTSWTTNTDNLPVLGISDIAIDYSNPSIMYIATGDGDFGSLSACTGSPIGDTKSVGVLKSTNGGTTWSATGLNWSVTTPKLIRRLVMNPVFPQELTAATSDGLWRTLNGGTNWTQVQTGYFMDVEFKPNNSDTLYASTYSPSGNAKIYRSTDYGTTWTNVITLPTVIRINLAVSPDWLELVDALCSDVSGGLAGLWYSNNNGATFSQYFTANCSNNLLHNSYNASGCGGQGFYDLAYNINPNNSNDIWIGGVNTWNSTDGGTTWYLKTIWTSGFPTSADVVHADKHFITFHPLVSGTIFQCNDGGLYKSTNGGTTWTDLSNGLAISQMYRIGVSQTINNNIICGLQDNGSREIYNNTWYEQTGGDGMECIIDYSNANTEYASYAYGVIYRTYNFWSTQTTISANIPGGQPNGAWVTPFVIHPTNPQILFAGYDIIYKTTNQGNSWTAISPVLTPLKLRSLAVAPSNANSIYAASFDTIYFTHNGGTNWFYVPLGIANAKISYIAVDPANDQNVYITLSGYAAGQKVYKSSDGGNNWVNYSGTLPNLPVNCIVYQNPSNEGLYVGTDVGVFYTDGTLPDWITYNTGLPNVVVTELEISNNNNKIWAATFGRGLWNSDLQTLTGISNTEPNSQFNIYPNPTNDILNIEAKGFSNNDFKIIMSNTLGQTLFEKEFKAVGNSFTTQIDLKEFSSGIYLLNILSEKGKQVFKVQKN